MGQTPTRSSFILLRWEAKQLLHVTGTYIPASFTLLLALSLLTLYLFVFFAAGVSLLQNLNPGRRTYAVRQVRVGDVFVSCMRIFEPPRCNGPRGVMAL